LAESEDAIGYHPPNVAAEFVKINRVFQKNIPETMAVII
jgi:hypothetical protein